MKPINLRPGTSITFTFSDGKTFTVGVSKLDGMMRLWFPPDQEKVKISLTRTPRPA